MHEQKLLLENIHSSVWYCVILFTRLAKSGLNEDSMDVPILYKL
jgi:hypothetical protein